MSGRLKQRQLVILGTLVFCVSAVTSHAATITVTNTNDSGPGSLRQALVTAQNDDTITFAVTGTITLTSGALPINKNITISGPGANQLSIDGDDQPNAVFEVGVGSVATISGLTATNATSGIYNRGTAVVTNCVLSGNIGGLWNDHAILSVSDCIITANLYGGIYNDNSHQGPSSSVEHGDHRRDANKIDTPLPDLAIANTTISDNSDGGLYNIEGFVTILNSTLSGNSVSEGKSGGGIRTDGIKLPGLVMVINSTISGNFASSEGGGISSGFSGLTIVNSTISGNSAPTCGGICGGTIEIGNTILNANTSGNIDGTVTSDGYNISSDDAGGLLTGPGDQINTDPLLDPLRNHGGPTLTHMPLRGSPAIDAGDPGFTPPPDHDQRGSCFYRVFGGRIDVGAVETQPRPLCVTPAPRPRR